MDGGGVGEGGEEGGGGVEIGRKGRKERKQDDEEENSLLLWCVRLFACTYLLRILLWLLTFSFPFGFLQVKVSYNLFRQEDAYKCTFVLLPLFSFFCALPPLHPPYSAAASPTSFRSPPSLPPAPSSSPASSTAAAAPAALSMMAVSFNV